MGLRVRLADIDNELSILQNQAMIVIVSPNLTAERIAERCGYNLERYALDVALSRLGYDPRGGYAEQVRSAYRAQSYEARTGHPF
jgi:hypothetical protein